MQFDPRLLTHSPSFTSPVISCVGFPARLPLARLLDNDLAGFSHRPVLSRHQQTIVLFVFQYWQIERIIVGSGTAQAQLARTAFAAPSALIGPAASSTHPITLHYSFHRLLKIPGCVCV